MSNKKGRTFWDFCAELLHDHPLIVLVGLVAALAAINRFLGPLP